ACVAVLVGCATTVTDLNSAKAATAFSAERRGCLLVRSDPPGAHIFSTSGTYLGETKFRLKQWNYWLGKSHNTVEPGGDDLGAVYENRCRCTRLRVVLTAKKRGYKDTTAEMW